MAGATPSSHNLALPVTAACHEGAHTQYSARVQELTSLGLPAQVAHAMVQGTIRIICHPLSDPTCAPENNVIFGNAANAIMPQLDSVSCGENEVAAFLMGLCHVLGHGLSLVNSDLTRERCMETCGVNVPCGEDWLETVSGLRSDRLRGPQNDIRVMYLLPEVSPPGIRVVVAAPTTDLQKIPEPSTGFVLPLESSYGMKGVTAALTHVAYRALFWMNQPPAEDGFGQEVPIHARRDNPRDHVVMMQAGFHPRGDIAQWGKVAAPLLSWAEQVGVTVVPTSY